MRTSLSILSMIGAMIPACGGADEASSRASMGVVTGTDLQLDLLGPGAVPVGANAGYQVVVSNLGTVTAPSAQAILTLPPGVTFVSASSGCSVTAPQRVTCNFGSVGSLRSFAKSVTLRHPSAGSVTVTGSAATTASDVVATNNNAGADTAVGTPAGGNLALAFPQNTAAVSCFGAGVTSFSQCSASSFVGAPFVLHGDGTIRTAGSTTGVWTQPSGPGSLRIEFRNAQGATTMIYNGVATSSRCVEGPSYNAALAPAGAFRACTQ